MEAAKSLKGYGLSKSFKGQYGSDYFKTIANVKKLEKVINELKDKAASCNNVAILQNIKVEADALKIRCLTEISEQEAKYIPVESDNSEQVETGNEPVKPVVKRNKTVSIKDINTAKTWQIESEADVKRYLAELEQKLISALEDDTVINVEF